MLQRKSGRCRRKGRKVEGRSGRGRRREVGFWKKGSVAGWTRNEGKHKNEGQGTEEQKQTKRSIEETREGEGRLSWKEMLAFL